MRTLQHTFDCSYIVERKNLPAWSRFISWCKNQESNRYGWVAGILAVHGCVLTPITVLFVALCGNNIALWMMAISAMAVALISNLAAMPTKVTIPVFFFSIVIDLVIVTTSLALYFS